MKKIFPLLILFLFLASGCGSSAFEPIVSQTTEVIQLEEEFDPLELIQDDENVGLIFEVVENTINNTIPGTYYVVYNITSADGNDSVEMTFYFDVADNDPPVLNVEDTITISEGTTFRITDYATAIDARDGDVSDQITYTGTVNGYQLGNYEITISVSDKYGNTTTKNVTVKVAEVDYDELAKNIAGYYVDYSYTDGQAPTLTIDDDGTFILYINSCSVVSSVQGEYMIYDGVIYMTSSSQPFSSDDESNLITFSIQADGSIVFNGELEICAPNKGDIFRKSETE